MFGFIVDDIKDYAGYLEWQDKIIRLNRQYHHKFYLNESDMLYCPKCGQVVVNYRRKSNKYIHIYDMRKCLHRVKLYAAEGEIVEFSLNY